jgi:hypothetical protein
MLAYLSASLFQLPVPPDNFSDLKKVDALDPAQTTFPTESIGTSALLAEL